MKIVFLSNYFNHHQKPFCDEMYRELGDDFTFVSTTVMRAERRQLGYSMEGIPPYVCLSYQDPQKKQQALALIRDADAVIAGSAPNNMLLERIRAGKPVFRYSERPYKKKPSRIKKAYHFIRFRQRDLFRKKNVYMLCASAYTAGDYAGLGMYRHRAYKWGYFPAVKEYDPRRLLSRKKTNLLLWCGRFLDWKHPDDALRLAQKLKAHGYDFQLRFVGIGAMEAELHQLAESLHLTDCIRFLGAMSPDEVRLHMEEAGIFLFTSDRQEGWGAVLNEAMNSGCAVVASHAIGSVPFLIQDGENGMVYPSENADSLFDKVKYLLDHPDVQARIGDKAYRTIRDTWNAQEAAGRFLHLAANLTENSDHRSPYENGPCSDAGFFGEDWLKG